MIRIELIELIIRDCCAHKQETTDFALMCSLRHYAFLFASVFSYADVVSRDRAYSVTADA